MDDGTLPPWTRHAVESSAVPDREEQDASLFGHEEEDICRVCRGEGTLEMPLMHPCKCSGSIKYVHQECLLQWIKTKKVTKCELCKYPFKLSKVYDPRMPSRVPHRLFFQRLLFQLRDNLLTYLRFLLVCFIWLGLVPFLARWIWRFYFRFGDWSADMTPPTNATMPEGNSTHVHGVFEDGLFGWLKGQDLWTSVLRDCFQGQIITICLVTVFVVVFLIREWVMQNALVADEIPIEQRELPQLAPFVDEPEVVDLPYAQGATGVEIEQHPQDDVHDDFTPPGSETDHQTQWDDMPVGPDPFQDEPRFPDWARQRTDYLVDPFVRPPPQAEDVEAALALRPDLQRPEIPLPPPEPFNNFDFNREFDDDDIDAEDFDGLWDIIGMQGPIIGLLHNTVFSALMIALAVGLGVWLPFMFGKTALGALAHPVDVLIQHPLTMARLAVDISLDAILFVIGGTLLSIHSTIRHVLGIFHVIPTLSTYAEYIDKTQFKETYLSLTRSSGQRILQVFNGSTRSDLEFLSHPFIQNIKTIISSYTDFTALKGTVTEKVIAVLAGYFIFTCLGAIYLRLRNLRNTEQDTTEKLIRDILRQAGAVIKVVIIITIELILFPIFCGVLIDLACLPLFSGATISTRWIFVQRFTFTATFLHWFAGTLYMFHFAMFISMCRDLVRAGTLYFIRDPNDPQFHPIREILERPTFHQLRKIGISGVIYALLILLCFGIVVKAVDIMGTMLPLQISTMEPIFEVPVDLLLSHIALPLTAHFVKPANIIKGAWRWWFETTARILRLSSFLFGVRVPDEEGSISFAHILRFKRRPSIDLIPQESFHADGSFLRVPATDTIPLHRRKQMLIPVTEGNDRLDGVVETDDQRNDIDFRVVYVPPNFTTRITIMFIWMWFYSVLLGLSATLIPLLLGRRLFIAFLGATTPMHDIYAYALGLYTLVATILLTEFTADKTSLLLRQDPQTVKRALFQATIRLVKWTYLVLLAGILLPLLSGAVLDLYIMMPFKRLVSPSSKMEIQIMQDWAFGIIHLKIAGRIILYLDGRHAQAMRNIFPGHWTNPNIRLATRVFIYPIIRLSLVALITPLVFAQMSDGIRWLLGRDVVQDKMGMYLSTYPIFMVVVGVIVGAVYARRTVDKWRDSVRDEIYLVGEVLHNLDDEGR